MPCTVSRQTNPGVGGAVGIGPHYASLLHHQIRVAPLRRLTHWLKPPRYLPQHSLRARSCGLDVGARRPAPCLRACGLNSDGLLPPHNREVIPDSDVIIFDRNVGHWPQLKDPNGVVRLFLDFVDADWTPGETRSG
jgi:pimeloyl-ACP methyl ester carboxylesterase